MYDVYLKKEFLFSLNYVDDKIHNLKLIFIVMKFIYVYSLLWFT